MRFEQLFVIPKCTRSGSIPAIDEEVQRVGA